MKQSIVLVSFFAAASCLAACNTRKDGAAEGSSAQAAAIPEVTIPQVAEILKAKSGTVVDANGEDTRKEYGVIPGAILLSNNKTFAMTELPADKNTKLVFYCGGVSCRASDSAAERAAENGYKQVSVLREGIKGWKKSGQATDTPRT
jgi:rhodanese-related sulfurtransferase